jgi:hypothetical protein
MERPTVTEERKSMKFSVRTVAIAASALTAVALISGCSSTSSSDAASPAASEVGGQVLPPVIVEEGQTEATAKVGDFIVFNTPADQLAGTTISTDQPDLLELSQAKQEGDALLNPGAQALAAGTAVVTVTSPDNSTRAVTITITE